MRTYHFILLLFTLAVCSISFLLSSFQLPQDKTTLQKRMEWFKRHQLLDSLITYQGLLVNVLEQEGTVEEIEESGAQFLTTIVESSSISMEEKWRLLKQTKLSDAWKYAYHSCLYLALEQQDSAYFYLNLLEASSENKTASIYTYGHWATKFATGRKDLNKAFGYLQKAEHLATTTIDSSLLYGKQGTIYSTMGYFDRGILAEQTIIRQERSKKKLDSIALAFAYDRLSMIYLEASNYEEAKKYVGEAINYMADRPTYLKEAAEMWYRLATCYFYIGNKPLETILYLRKVFSLLELADKKTSASKEILVDACAVMGLQFLAVKQADSAQVYVDKAQRIQEKEAYKLGEIWAVQAKINADKGAFLKAELSYEKAIAQTKKDYGSQGVLMATRLLEFGEYYGLQKKYKQAQKYLNDAFWALSTVLDKKEFPSINTIFSKKEAIKIITLKIEAMLALYENSKYNVSLKDIYKHAQYNLELLQGIKIDHQFEFNFLAFGVSVYEQAIEACELLHRRHQENRYLREAFQLAEEAKLFLLDKMMEEPKNQTFGAVSPQLIQAELKLQEQLAWYQQRKWEAILVKDSIQINWCEDQLILLKTNHAAIKKELATKYPKYYRFKYQSQVSKLDSIQEALNDSTVIVQYLEGKRSIYQFIIKKDDLAIRKIFWRTYKPTILKYYNHFTHSKLQQHTQSGGFKDFCITSYELYHKLMHHELLNNAKRIIIVPDGLLNYIPFGTLLTDIPLDRVHKIDFPSLAYLLKKKRLNYQYSSSLWLNELNKTKTSINNELLGMAATYEEEEVASFRSRKIKGIRAELTAGAGRGAEIDSLSLKYAGDFYTNRYATEYYLKDYASDYGIMHLALYGRIDPIHPEYSSLVFAEDNYEEEDNLLTINEIKQLDLHTSMVVLSNCQTGYGPYERGEGVISLGRSFMYAGSPSVILSLWEQNADYSSILMDYFYDNLKQKMDKDEALRQAKLRYLAVAKGMDAHPAYWAGFIAIGNYEEVKVSEPVIYIWWFIIPIAFLGFLGWWSMQALRQRR